MSYGSGPAPYGDQPPYGGQAPYGGGPAPYGAPNQFGQFGAPALTPDIAPLPGAGFGDAVKRFFQRYAQFRGYASRSEFWYVYLFNTLVTFGLYMVMLLGGALTLSSDSSGESTGVFAMLVSALLGLYGLAIIIPTLALAVRRLHDNGKSGLWLFISFIPGGSIVLLVFFCMESRPDLYRPEWS
ncbi:hypothetical protein HMPREF0975_01831 [Actinomyces sp. oral taxon 849 str. F0330]|uniref:DUF805 domain-containing protein n=1 Tax=Actinomyces sp. oral taxon 849 TaxID=653385 RepID=UPI000242FE2D|nr:DUF805 domain-containing protein [Actinomyces sp. oral taxon 849]EHM93542.1 hypothetical protein HMPREF0975_01831 [Actinomyces sp. oral taxon 849 str. F0330]